MITAKIIKKVIDDLKNITQINLAIFNNTGNVIASNINDLKFLNKYIFEFLNCDLKYQCLNNFIFFKVFEKNGSLLYIVIGEGNFENTIQICKICVSQLENLILTYNNKNNKISFIQNLILDNMLLSDIYNKAKALNIENNLKRVAILIETKFDKDDNSLNLIKNIFNEKDDFIISLDEKYILFLKALKNNENEKEVFNICNILLDMCNTELMIKAKISYGSIVDDLKNISKSYKEAKMCLEICNIFYSGKNVIGYDCLGIGRLIYQLPTNICHIFIKEILKEQNIHNFDEELLTTIYKFFENNLNISETARNLYIHRNTLVYRLEKIQKLTGLDIKKFDEALTFKIAIMISDYIKYKEQNKK